MDAFNCSNGDAATVFAVANALTFFAGLYLTMIQLPSFTGPLASACILVYGMRACLFGGTIITVIGYVMVYWAESINYVVVCAAFIGAHLSIDEHIKRSLLGFGSCFVRIILVAVQPLYFEKYRTFAMTFVMVGPGVGMFIFPAFITNMIHLVDWRASFIINGALCCLVRFRFQR